MFDREYDPRPLRLEFIGKGFIFEPQTIERLALGWTVRINLAACPFVAELAPLIHRLFQRGDRHHFATERATSAGSHGTLSATPSRGAMKMRHLIQGSEDAAPAGPITNAGS